MGLRLLQQASGAAVASKENSNANRRLAPTRAFVNEWPATLDELKKLDFDTVLPGHGEAFTDKAKIDYFQAYLRDVWSQVSRFKQQGLSAEDAAKQADLTKHKEHFPTIQAPGVPIIAVTRIYELLDRGAGR